MRKLKERFHRKHGIVSRIFSMVLALAMIVTMVPAAFHDASRVFQYGERSDAGQPARRCG